MDDAGEMRKTSTVPEIKPLDQYDFNRAKVCASVRWLLAKSYGSAENVPVELRDPLYRDQYNQEHLKPSVSKLLLSPELYCRTHALLHGASQPAAQGPPGDNSALLQLLTKRGLLPWGQDGAVTESDLVHTPIKTTAHLVLIDALMSLAAMETVGKVKMAAEADHMGGGAPWENALLFWVNRLNQKLRESTEEQDAPEAPTCTDLQPVQPACPNRWYWKLVPIRYRKDKVQSKQTPTFPLVSGVKDLSNGCAIAAVLHYYCPELLPLEDVCLKDTMSVADSLYNLQMIKDFCETSLQSCCPLALEDLLYAPPTLHVNIMTFVSDLLGWFEVQKPDFVKPLQPIDLTDASGLLDCTSPVSGNSNSGSPSFIFKQPFVPISSPMSPEGNMWTKKQISRPLSAVTFSIPFGLDSDVDVVMGNPVRSASSDSLTAGVPATMTSSGMKSSGMTRVPYSPPEDLSHLVSSSAPKHSSWGPHAHSHTPPLGELPTIEEALQVSHAPGGGKGGAERGGGGGKGERGGEKKAVKRPEPRLRPEGAPAGFFLHSPEDNLTQLSSSAPCHTGMLYRPIRVDGGEGKRPRGGDGEKGEMDDRGRRSSKGSRDDDSVLRDGSMDSSEASDDAPRNAPGNVRPAHGRQGNGSVNNTGGGSPRMTSFAERRDRRRQSGMPGEESVTNPATPALSGPNPGTPTLHASSNPGTPTLHASSNPGTPGRQASPGGRHPEPGTEAWELGVRLEEKRRAIEAQKRRIEAIFTRHRQRLGKTAFLQLKREQGEGGGEGEEDPIPLEERLTRMEEQLKEEEEKEEREKGKEKAEEGSSRLLPRLEKQVTFSVDTRKGAGNVEVPEQGGGAVLGECNEVVLKLTEALRSLQDDMQKLTRQQQQLMGQRTTPKTTPKTTPRTPPKTPNKCLTPTKSPTRTPTKSPTPTPTKSLSKAWMIPAGVKPSSPANNGSRKGHAHLSSTPPKTPMSSSCPAPRTKIHSSSSSAPRSPKHHPRTSHPHPRPSELKFPPSTRVLTPAQHVDSLPHLRRVSPSQCQVQTASSFRIGSPRTPKDPPPAPVPRPEESASDTGSGETPTQFSLELEELEGGGGGLPVFPQNKRGPPGGGGSSSGAPSECSFESETLSLSAAYCGGGMEAGGSGAGGRTGGEAGGKRCSLMEVSLSSLGGPEGGSDEPTDTEGQEFFSDSMSDHTEPTSGEPMEPSDSLEPIVEPRVTAVEPRVKMTQNTELLEHTMEPVEQTDLEGKGGLGFFFKEDVRCEDEMAQRRAALLERQQKRTEELKKRYENDRESRPRSAEELRGCLPHTPPTSCTPAPAAGVPSLTPPSTPGRRGDFTRREYAHRQQIRIMADLEKVLQQKHNNQGRGSIKKPRPRPQSVTREESQLSRSPAKGPMGSKLTKVYSHSSLNLAATTDDSGNMAPDQTAPDQTAPDQTAPDQTAPDQAAPDQAAPDQAAPDQAAPDQVAPDNNVPDKSITRPSNKPSQPDSPCRLMSPSRLVNQNGDKDWENESNGSSPSIPEYTGPKLFKEPSFKSNKYIIHNALSRCCLAGKVNETQKNKIMEEMEKSPANHFLILFRDSNCQFRAVYTMSPEADELVRLAGVGPRVISPALVESIYKYSSDRKQFSCIPSKTLSMSVDAFTLPGHLWHGKRPSTPKKSGTPK
ncbi:calmodulin-regulated spectrin-associated protein 3 isoform X3 [Esox lucius]|uniref:Calmodulin-regulated spectrin-associated protein 3-like n=1 Tax=Esox lucius TaxID=8010 RepID=A0A3P8Y5P8_ESOLU|nr:calmodulin-regulated spectrin-associated protein 3 isoform X3 [Esox lucius]